MKQLSKSLFTLFPRNRYAMFAHKNIAPLTNRAMLLRPKAYFCDKPMQTAIPKQNRQITHQEVVVGEEVVDSFKTKGAISILDHIKGAKQSETGELYALMFRCGKCDTRSIRSFTKNAYHHGVVMIRCEGCQNVHLVADNLGWFEDDVTNLDNLGEGKVQKVHDPVAIVSFLKSAFGEQAPKNVEKPQSK